MTLLEQARQKVFNRLQEEGKLGESVFLRAKVLSAEEAIGNPEDYDFPLQKGKEKMVEADFNGYKGHAFSDMYGGFKGPVNEVLSMSPTNNYRRALQVATINALTRFWGMVEDTIHCKDNQPKECAWRCLSYLKEHYPEVRRISFFGFQPALVDVLNQHYTLQLFDLSEDNIGQEHFGLWVYDGEKDFAKASDWADLVIATGSSIVNGTIDRFQELKPRFGVVYFGVTIAGAAALCGLTRMCFPNEF